MQFRPAAALCVFAITLVACAKANVDWPVYQGSDEKTHYTTLSQNSPANMSTLKVAWTYDTRDAFEGSEMQSNPVIIDGCCTRCRPNSARSRSTRRSSSARRCPRRSPRPPRDIRAYDVKSGAIRWTFHTIPRPGEFGYETWPPNAWKVAGGMNAWSGVTVDQKRGMVFFATGSASFDFYGANRLGDNLFANSIVALDANTGKRVWLHQALKHDLWDRDLPAAPTLVTVTRDGKQVDAVAQITKTGHVWLLDRDTEPNFFQARGAGCRPPFSTATSLLTRSAFRPSPSHSLVSNSQRTGSPIAPRKHAPQPSGFFARTDARFVDAAQHERDYHLPRRGWWRRVWRSRVRSEDRPALREFERDGMDSEDRGTR